MSSSNNIIPEKITHPFQLMAAWFVMIIIVSSILLTAAAKISSPLWAAGFLVISAVSLIFLVVLCVFLMLTKFRPHLQTGPEYATWLRDERRYSTRGYLPPATTSPSLAARLAARRRVRSSDAAHPGTEKILTQAAGVGVEVTALDGAEDLVGALSSLGFSASIYELSYDKEGVFPEDHQAIWIGYLIAPDVVMLAIKTALKQWPFLRYLHLSQDSGGPDDTHRQIYFGGSTGTAVGRYELVSWSVDELNGIPDGIGIEKFHKLIRDKYTKDTREA